ncbi:hypothetical protein ACFQ3Z_05090 [Streptomyces nogalater]
MRAAEPRGVRPGRRRPGHPAERGAAEELREEIVRAADLCPSRSIRVHG